MERIKMKLIMAVTDRLSAAADSDEKADLVEELSENLYQRYQSFIVSGMNEEEAYAKTLEELGDVDELLEFLGVPRQERPQSDLGQNIEDICRNAMDLAREAVSQSKGLLRDAAAKLKEKYPDGFNGQAHGTFYFHSGDEDDFESFDDDDEDEDLDFECFDAAEEADAEEFYAAFHAEGLRALDLRLDCADVRFNLTDDGEDVTVCADSGTLHCTQTESGVLLIEESASHTRGILKTIFNPGCGTVTLTLPRRHWDSVRLTTASGDIFMNDDLDADRLIIQTANGDVIARGVTGSLKADSANGDIVAEGSFGAVQVGAASGDIILRGSSAGNVKLNSASGDVALTLDHLPEQVSVNTCSGDCRVSIPGNQGFTLSSSTMSGDLRTNFPLEGSKGHKTYLGGGNSHISISTMSGDVVLRQM